jgi:hypothetical protein
VVSINAKKQAMKRNNDPATDPASLSPFYFVMSVGFALLLPASSALAEHIVDNARINWNLPAKWLIFWGVGIRLFTAGLKQASTPEHMAIQILKLRTRESFVVIRELGFAKIALGIMGILSVLNDNWRMLAAIASMIFFGFSALQHSIRKPGCSKECIALLYDAFITVCLAIYLLTQ